LTSRDRIVSGQRAAAIVKDCLQRGVHFRCHKGDAAGLNVHCRGVHERGAGQAYRFAVACRIPVREIDTDALA
jgi:hypothetical protein